MEKLIKKSFKISRPIVVVWPQYSNIEKTLDVSDIKSKFNGAYSTNNSTICFVYNKEVFVTPYTREALATLRKAGLKRDYFYVPFSNWDYPRDWHFEWQHLRKLADESHYRDFETDCEAWCNDHGIGSLSEDTLKRCFKIPREGVPIEKLYKDTVFPKCNEYSMDCTTVDRLGNYCSNNGKVVFVYRNGHTYVTKGYWIINELKMAGYKETGLFVPFSNGETITDHCLAAEWEHICSINDNK